jgi:hypothetical protein
MTRCVPPAIMLREFEQDVSRLYAAAELNPDVLAKANDERGVAAKRVNPPNHAATSCALVFTACLRSRQLTASPQCGGELLRRDVQIAARGSHAARCAGFLVGLP